MLTLRQGEDEHGNLNPCWFGWRAAGATNFGKFCGIQNEVPNMRNTDELKVVSPVAAK